MDELYIPPELIHKLSTTQNITVLTGAGISEESGLRTFRDPQNGVWSQVRPEDLATPEAFQRSPKLVWEWYAARRERLAEVQPNPAHYALVEMASHVRVFTLVTQNVDDLHRKAGSRDVIELHGNLGRVKCSRGCGLVEKWTSDKDIPCCPKCGAYLRPDVVWFGEQLPLDALERAVQAARSCQVFFSIGTSGLVQPASALAFSAKNQNALVVEINLEVTPLSEQADFTLHGRAGKILPVLVEKVWG